MTWLVYVTQPFEPLEPGYWVLRDEMPAHYRRHDDWAWPVSDAWEVPDVLEHMPLSVIVDARELAAETKRLGNAVAFR